MEASNTLPNTNPRTLEQRQDLIGQVAHEVESWAQLLQRAANENDCDGLWLRGAGARLEELASIAMACAGDDCKNYSIRDLEGRLYGPEWLRCNRSAA